LVPSKPPQEIGESRRRMGPARRKKRPAVSCCLMRRRHCGAFCGAALWEYCFSRRKKAVVTNPTRGAKPLWQGVAPRGRRWQNLLTLVVFAGWWSGHFCFVPLPATCCQRSLRRFLRHPQKRTFVGAEGPKDSNLGTR
jgi:hypothetical protein